MTSQIQHDWTAVLGQSVEIRRYGEPLRVGLVDAVTPDGSILWILSPGIVPRMMVERLEGYEVWIETNMR